MRKGGAQVIFNQHSSTLPSWCHPSDFGIFQGYIVLFWNNLPSFSVSSSIKFRNVWAIWAHFVTPGILSLFLFCFIFAFYNSSFHFVSLFLLFILFDCFVCLIVENRLLIFNHLFKFLHELEVGNMFHATRQWLLIVKCWW